MWNERDTSSYPYPTWQEQRTSPYMEPFTPYSPLGYKIIGTCSLCGGNVMVLEVYHSAVPPTPTCQSCRAQPRKKTYPVIDMERPYYLTHYSTSNRTKF